MENLAEALGAIAAWHWLVLGLALLIGELLTGTTYLLWPAAAAWLVGLVMLFVPLGWPGQLAVFGLITLASAFSIGRYVRGRWPQRRAEVLLNDAGARLIGARARALGAFANGKGRLQLGDTVWEGQSAAPIHDGDSVEVIALEGASLIVRPAPEAS